MSSVYYPKPRGTERWTGKPKLPNTVCQKTLHDGRWAHLCHAPTLDGKQYCDDCFKETLTGKDRKPPSQVEPEQYHWTNDKPRKRA